MEKNWASQVYEIMGEDLPFWLLSTGSQLGVPGSDSYRQPLQRVVDYFRGKILFVQVEEDESGHPPLRGVLNLGCQSNLRQLVRLIYHAQGILCPATSLMHLAGAVEPRKGKRKRRPLVTAASPGEEMVRQVEACVTQRGLRFLTPREWRLARGVIENQVEARTGLACATSTVMHKRAFAVACDAAYFPGLRALLNSIVAYHGNTIPVFVYYRDLNGKQLQQVRQHPVGVHLVELAELPFPSPGMWEAKQQIFAHSLGRARCVYLLDADLVLVSRLDDVFEMARAGKIVSSADGQPVTYDSSYGIYHPKLEGFSQPYINSGALCLDVVQHWDLVALWSFASQHAAYSAGKGGPLSLPGHGDQGVFNAIAAQLGKTLFYHILPEGTWCDCTRGCTLKVRRRPQNGQLEVWNVGENAMQRLVHSSGPKWWTTEGAAHLKRFGDKLGCFRHFSAPAYHFAATVPLRRTSPKKSKIKTKLLIGICSCLAATVRRQSVRATWLKRLPKEAIATFFLGGGRALDEEQVIQLPARDDYASLPQKVQAFFCHALERYEFDYLLKCDDDTYVCAERLLDLIRPGADYIGGMDWVSQGYASGGAGYLLSRKAVQILASTPPPACGPEDVWVGQVLRQSGLKLCPTPRLLMDHRKLPAPDNDLISAHWCSPELMQTIHRGFMPEAATQQ